MSENINKNMINREYSKYFITPHKSNIFKRYDYNFILGNKIKLKDLKDIKKKYRISCTLNKSETINVLYNLLRIWDKIFMIARAYKSYLIRKYVRLQQLERYMNDDDFEQLENLKTYNKLDIMCIRDDDGVFGFTIESIVRLIKKYKMKAFNPYTRNLFNLETHKRVHDLYQLRYVLKINKEDTEISYSIEKQLDFKILDVFYQINNLGNYADSDWLDQLNATNLILYLRELQDIWEYRANLSNTVKRDIYTNLNPFYDVQIGSLRLKSYIMIKTKVVKVIERFISSSKRECASLGAFYVLGALTLVNQNAATAIPWLYQSMYHT